MLRKLLKHFYIKKLIWKFLFHCHFLSVLYAIATSTPIALVPDETSKSTTVRDSGETIGNELQRSISNHY